MSYTPHYIANFDENGGLGTYYEPFMLPEKAFPVLEDAYAFRGKIKRRQGFVNLGRLRRVLKTQNLGNTAATPWAFNIYTLLLITGEPNAEIQEGSVIITIGGPIVFTDDGLGNLNSATPGNIGTINYATGDVVLTHTAGPGIATTIDFNYFPGLPVMGLPDEETVQINQQNLLSFDTKYAYYFAGGYFQQLPLTLAINWNGTDYDFFWTTNYWQNNNGKLVWVTNFHRGATNDPIYYWDTANWTAFAPIIRADNATTPSKLLQARVIVAYKSRLVVMNTYEGDNTTTVTNYPQRVRFSQDGDPTVIGVVAAGPVWTTVGAWADDVPGYGGYIDIPTSEQIISAEFIKDTLLIKCERSSWKVIYTGVPSTPFIFEKINTVLGAESTFSLVPFDRGVLAVGNYALTTDDSIGVERIDIKIPQWIFDINNDNNGVKRVCGIRDYPNESAYWSYPASQFNPTFPNKLLVYNYRNETFAIFNDSFTALGYYQPATDSTWGTLEFPTWSSWTTTWASGVMQSEYPKLVGGNQHGYIEVLNQQVFNDFSLFIKAFTTGGTGLTQLTVYNHNLQNGQFIKIDGVIDILSIYSPLNGNIYKVLVVDADTLTLIDSTGANIILTGGSYIGGGQITVLNNMNIETKTFASFYEQGGQARLSYIDFLLDRTSIGEVSMDIYIDENDSIPINSISLTSGNSGNLGSDILLTRPENATLIPFQANQSKIWHRDFVQATCQNFYLYFYFSDEQMFNESINASDFVLHSMVIYLSKNARLTQ